MSKIEQNKEKEDALRTFYNKHIATGSSEETKIPGKEDDDGSPAIYEGIELAEEGAVGLITYMRTDSFQGGF